MTEAHQDRQPISGEDVVAAISEKVEEHSIEPAPDIFPKQPPEVHPAGVAFRGIRRAGEVPRPEVDLVGEGGLPDPREAS